MLLLAVMHTRISSRRPNSDPKSAITNHNNDALVTISFNNITNTTAFTYLLPIYTYGIGSSIKDVRTEGGRGYGPMRTKADKGVDFTVFLRTSFMDDPNRGRYSGQLCPFVCLYVFLRDDSRGMN